MSESQDPGIELRGVSKRYGTAPDSPFAVNGISLQVPRGTVTAILGPSGCGKTTLLRLIAGLEQPTQGSVHIRGRDVTRLGPAERDVSLMFQGYALFPHMDVADNVMYGLKMSGLARAAAQDRASQALCQMGLAGLERRLPGELSGGQQQRVALARALVLEPAVLLLDEPLSNLDARLRREMREEIRALQQRLGLTVAYVTHDQAEALTVSDRIIVMDHGAVAQAGTPQAVYEAPASEFVAGFMGEAVLLPASVEPGGMVALGPLRIRAPEGRVEGAVKVAVRPQAWRMGPPGAGLDARLTRLAYLGSHYEYTFDTELGPIFVISHELERVLEIGCDVGLGLAEHGVSVVQVS